MNLKGAVVPVYSVTQLYPLQLFVTPWTAAHQAPLFMRFPRQEYWSGLPFPSPGDFPDPGIKPMSLALAAVFFTTEPTGKPCAVQHKITAKCLNTKCYNYNLFKLSHGQGLVGYSPWGCKESDTTEHVHPFDYKPVALQ